jgi:DNA-binding response OmpR family regulator
MKMPEHSRVLYVENDEDSYLMVSILLEFSNIEVIAAKTVADAWQTIVTESFDLYLLDSRLPDGSGLDLCRRLREYAPHTPILIYSANAFESDKQKGLEAGATAYLTKPYINDLTETIRLAISFSQKPAAVSFGRPVRELQNRDLLPASHLQPG